MPDRNPTVSKVTFSISDRLPRGLGGGLVEVLHIADEGGRELLLRVVCDVNPVQAKTTLQEINFYTNMCYCLIKVTNIL